MNKINKEYLPFISTSRETSLGNKTGDWRTQKPVFERKLSPCTKACPLGNDIPLWISLVKQGKCKKAWEALIEKNPLPAVTGRVCQGFCEKDCNRSEFDEALSINALERFLGERALKQGWKPQPIEGKKSLSVAVIGSGPAGLSCAYQLTKRGYQVTIFEILPVIGGMLRVGIPEFRLPKNILKKEIKNNILSLGVKIEKNVEVDELTLKMISERFDAVFVAVGLQKSKKLDIPGEESDSVLYGLEFLKDVNLGKKVKLGKKVVVIGGGNTAIDAARTAKKMGSEVKIIYRRTKNEMPAIKTEIEEAEKEGIKIRELTGPVEIIIKKGWANFLKLQKMALGEPDETGRKRPIPIEGSNFLEEFDNLIVAAGEEVNKSLGLDPEVKVGTVAAAIGSGREAAEAIERKLLSQSLEETKTPTIVRFEDLNLDYFKHQERVNDVSSLVSAQREAERCFSCGWCNRCRNCQIFCPEVAVSEQNGEYQINYDYCKGCGICTEECPTRTIVLELEEKEV